MGRVYYWTEVEMCPRQEAQGLARLISAIQTFRTALVNTKRYFTQTVYPTPIEELQVYHQLVFQTSVALNTQNRIIARAMKLIRYVRFTHFNKQAQRWDDEELEFLLADLSLQATRCSKETREMMAEMGTRFKVEIRFYDRDETPETASRATMDNILQNGMQERHVNPLTTEFRF
ncbi:hypothetical protein TWF281_002952 [Arthrobotrys megalospora]